MSVQINKSLCRACGVPLTQTFVDLGLSPFANSYVNPSESHRAEKFYPLHAYVCSSCFLVQLEEFESPENIFGDYLYFSSFSTLWLEHARNYVSMITERLKLGADSLVVEIASNDGYLLKNFKERKIPILGVEPAANVAAVAVKAGIPSEVAFFGEETAKRLVKEGKRADLLVANNVLAHVPDINDFVSGMKVMLKPQGTITVEFPHLLRLIEENQFDTIYHEHFSYLSLLSTEKVFKRHGLKIFDVEKLTTHGGSLRIYATHADNNGAETTERFRSLLDEEASAGLNTLDGYKSYGPQVIKTKCDVLEFLLRCRKENRSVVAYGAPAKGNTLLNYCGVGPELIEFTVDRSPHKQGLLLPGTRIPIRAPEAINERKPDYVFILPWNLRDEIVEQMSQIRSWGGKFVVPIPSIQVI